MTTPGEALAHVSVLNYVRALVTSMHEALDWSSLLLFSYMGTACLPVSRPR
jgi:hypothetical protein